MMIVIETQLPNSLVTLTSRERPGVPRALGVESVEAVRACPIGRMRKEANAMRKAITIILAALCLTSLVQAQERQPREVWNEVFTKRLGREFPHNKFLAETIRGRKPGRALDIGMGEGRN